MPDEGQPEELEFELEKDRSDQRHLAVRIGRDEMNLAEFPFTVLSHRVPGGVNTIKSVSYTHLDVYKRQVIVRLSFIGFIKTYSLL